jgi:hypothetical protein
MDHDMWYDDQGWPGLAGTGRDWSSPLVVDVPASVLSRLLTWWWIEVYQIHNKMVGELCIVLYGLL